VRTTRSFAMAGVIECIIAVLYFDEATRQPTHREVTCYAESDDGIHWIKPNLGLYEFHGSKNNNIVWDGIGTHCFVVFKDENPSLSTRSAVQGESLAGARKASEVCISF